MAKTSFVKRVQNTPKMKSVRSKIKKNEAARKKLSAEFKRTLKSESKRLSKSTKSKSKSKKKSKRR